MCSYCFSSKNICDFSLWVTGVCVQGQPCAVKLHEILTNIVQSGDIYSTAFSWWSSSLSSSSSQENHCSELTKMCSSTLVWWASGIFKGNPIRPYQAEAHGKGRLHKHLITLILAAISLVSFVSVPQTSSTTESSAAAAEPLLTCQQFCQHHAPEQQWRHCLQLHIETNPSSRSLTSAAQWNSWILTSPLCGIRMINHSTTSPVKWVTFLPSLLLWIETLAELQKVTMPVFNMSLMQYQPKAKASLQVLFPVTHQCVVWAGISLVCAPPCTPRAQSN